MICPFFNFGLPTRTIHVVQVDFKRESLFLTLYEFCVFSLANRKDLKRARVDDILVMNNRDNTVYASELSADSCSLET